jgi:D-3-phosphoglycerate dehydrogenase
MTVLVADKFEQSGLDGLAALGVTVLSEPDLKDDSLQARIHESGAEVLIVRSTKVTRPMLEGSNLKVVIRAGAGYNTIDVKSATEFGIKVANCPGKNAQAVSELAFALILALDRFVPDNVSQLRAGKWNKKGFSKAKGLYGRTLGLVGLGNIGRDMIAKAKSFGMSVVAFSRHTSADEAAALGIRLGTLDEVAACDVVSVHCSLTDETRGLLGSDFFSKMAKGSLFINTSRAEVVDQAALLDAVKNRGIRAGLDVFDDEPTSLEGDYTGPLVDEPNVYVTHHIGASTEQAQEAVADETVRIVREYQANGSVPNAVN